MCTLEQNVEKTFIPEGLTEKVNVSQLLNGIEDGEMEEAGNARENTVLKQEFHITTTAESNSMKNEIKGNVKDSKFVEKQVTKHITEGDQYNAGRDIVTESANRTFKNTGEIQGSNVNLGDNSTQTITARDINFGTVTNQAEFVSELKNLQQELNKAIDQKLFPDDIKFDVGNRINKAVKQAEKSEPKGILKHLGKLGGLVGGVNTAVELLKSINDAREKVSEIFSD